MEFLEKYNSRLRFVDEVGQDVADVSTIVQRGQKNRPLFKLFSAAGYRDEPGDDYSGKYVALVEKASRRCC